MVHGLGRGSKVADGALKCANAPAAIFSPERSEAPGAGAPSRGVGTTGGGCWCGGVTLWGRRAPPGDVGGRQGGCGGYSDSGESHAPGNAHQALVAEVEASTHQLMRTQS